MKRIPNVAILTALIVLPEFGHGQVDSSDPAAVEALVARAESLELDTNYVPPPGDPLTHHASGYAKILCSAVFVTGLDPEFAAENIGYFTAPYAERARLGEPVVDRDAQEVSVSVANGVTRTARYYGDQGCVTLPIGTDDVSFTPRAILRELPGSDTQAWPMGDIVPDEPMPDAIDADKLNAAVDAAFTPEEALTAAFVVTWKGQMIAERYGAGATVDTALESWSMGKSVTAALIGILIEQGVYELDQRAPIPEWQAEGDPRQEIRIRDILNMSSGIRIVSPLDPDYDPAGSYPDHVYLYTGGVDAFHYAATRPLQWPPGTVGRYRNTDPVLANYLVRLAVEERGEDYLSFPQRALFDRIGVRTMVIEPDPFGNFLTQGYKFASARDWARIGNLFLQDGVWNGERVLPEGFVDFIRTPAPAWAADGRPIYGGFFWLNNPSYFGLPFSNYPGPTDAYFMSGAGGQTTMIVPSHDLVVVRLGHFKGAAVGAESFAQAMALLVEGVPRSDRLRREN